MIKKLHIVLMTLIGTTLLTGCETDNDNDNAPLRYTLEFEPLSSSFLQVEPWNTRSVSDHLPTGYVPFNELYPTTPPDPTTIGVFMTPERFTTTADFIYRGNDALTGLPGNNWRSTVSVTDGTQYFIYGFMPREEATSSAITPLAGNFATGATITMNGIHTLTTADVCVVAGLRKALPSEDLNSTLTSDIMLGSFGYLGEAEGSNRVFLLLRHLYAGLRFRIHIDPDYHRLRTIMLKKLELTATDIPETTNISVTLRANNTGDDPVETLTFTPGGGATTNTTIQLFPQAGGAARLEIPEAVTHDFQACFVPSSCRTFRLTSLYDVYDRKGNLIRENCIAENAINSTVVPDLRELPAGSIYTIDLLVEPSYLYVLSDPDLDNPTITFE